MNAHLLTCWIYPFFFLLPHLLIVFSLITAIQQSSQGWLRSISLPGYCYFIQLHELLITTLRSSNQRPHPMLFPEPVFYMKKLLRKQLATGLILTSVALEWISSSQVNLHISQYEIEHKSAKMYQSTTWIPGWLWKPCSQARNWEAITISSHQIELSLFFQFVSVTSKTYGYNLQYLSLEIHLMA